MVKLTQECIERKCSQITLNKSLSKQLEKSQLCNLTHLRMHDMFISSIGNLGTFKNLKVIHLQNNNVSKIENLQFATNLTHLYLQHNAITKLENLESLQRLQTLHLGHNGIAVVEGLENLSNLTVLQIESQRISYAESLCFDPRTVLALSTCLKVLNIADNKITSLGGIENLYELEVLDASNNAISDIDDLTESINTLTALGDLSVQGNPVTRCYRFKENLIANNDTLANLNGKMVTDICRCFMKRFKIEKHLRRTKKASKLTLDEDITSSLNLPPAFKRSISRAMFQYNGPKLSIAVSSALGDSKPQIFPPWKTAPGANAVRGCRIAPRPFWGNVTKKKQSNAIQSLTNSNAVTLPPI